MLAPMRPHAGNVMRNTPGWIAALSAAMVLDAVRIGRLYRDRWRCRRHDAGCVQASPGRDRVRAVHAVQRDGAGQHRRTVREVRGAGGSGAAAGPAHRAQHRLASGRRARQRPRRTRCSSSPAARDRPPPSTRPLIDFALRDVRKQRDIVLVDQRGTGASQPAGVPRQQRPGAAPARRRRHRRRRDRRLRAALHAGPGRQGGSAPVHHHATRSATWTRSVARSARSASTWSACRTARASRSSTRCGIRSTRVRLCSTAWRPTTWSSAASSRARSSAHWTCRPRTAVRFPAAASASRRTCATQLRELKARLADAPVSVDYRDPSTGGRRRDTLTADTVVGVTHLFSYMPQMMSLLPVVIDEADRGDYALADGAGAVRHARHGRHDVARHAVVGGVRGGRRPLPARSRRRGDRARRGDGAGVLRRVPPLAARRTSGGLRRVRCARTCRRC